MKNLINYIVGFLSCVLMFGFFFFGTPKQKVKKVQTETYVCNTSGLAKSWIDKKVKEGFHVQYLIGQPVSVAVAFDGKQYGRKETMSVRGDLIIVMTKETYE